jgi:hypothetical protein
MRTIAEYAREMAFRFLAEYERTIPALADEDCYIRQLGPMWDALVRDLDAYVYYGNGYTDGEARDPQELVLRRLLKARPVRQAAVQTFLEHFILDWERIVLANLAICEAQWREAFLSIAEEVYREADDAYISKGHPQQRGGLRPVAYPARGTRT